MDGVPPNLVIRAAQEGQGRAHSDVNHILRDVDALLVVAHQATPPYQPAEGAFHHPASGLDRKSLLPFELTISTAKSMNAALCINVRRS